MQTLRAILLALLATGLAAASFAAGTPAGTVIDNRAQISAVINGAPVNKTSNLASFTVDEVLDLALVWQDGASVAVQPGDPARMLTFLLTNTGNGGESFLLAVDNAVAGDQFDPQNPAIYLDSNGSGGFEPGTDLPYDAATNRPTLAADQGVVIFVFNDIPADAADGVTGISRLYAAATTGSGPPGTAYPPAAPGGPYAIVGASGGQASADGTYTSNGATVTLTKSAQVSDPDGGSEPVAGATITYAILVEVAGAGTAGGLVVADRIPANTSYAPGSMRLLSGGPAKVLTDAADADEGALVENPPGSGSYQVNFSLGNLNATIRTVTFQVTID